MRLEIKIVEKSSNSDFTSIIMLLNACINMHKKINKNLIFG